MTFTTETPTQPGAYWWKGYSDAIPRFTEVFVGPDGGLWYDRGTVESHGGLWCRLVAAEEVKEAWAEGRASVCTDKDGELLEMWANSRAKKVVEGKE